jgi:hypothetical protein
MTIPALVRWYDYVKTKDRAVLWDAQHPAAAQIPVGILLDRFGPRRVQSVLLLVAAVVPDPKIAGPLGRRALEHSLGFCLS